MTVNTVKDAVADLKEKISGKTIKSTTDYSIFKRHPQNRDVIDNKKLKNLIGSIEESDLLCYNPIIVDDQMRVINGQHRLEAAKKLNRPIYYIIAAKACARDLFLLNTHQSRFRPEDYHNFFREGGDPGFKLLDELSKKEGLSIRVIALLFSDSKRSDVGKIFKSGIIPYPNEEKLTKIKEQIANIKNTIAFIKSKSINIPKYIYSDTFRSGLALFLKKGVNMDKFLKRLEFYLGKIRTSARAAEYMAQFEELYQKKVRSSSIKLDFEEEALEA